MSHSKIRKALNTIVRQYCSANNIPIHMENIVADPDTTKPFFNTYSIPASTTSNSLAGDHKRSIGIYQITICVPANEGTGRVTDYIDDLQELFPVFSRVVFDTSTGDYATIMSPIAPARGDVNEGVFSTPVSITYRSDTL